MFNENLCEFFEEGNLGGVDKIARVFEGKPFPFIYFGKCQHLAATARPFHFKCITGNCTGIEITGARPCIDAFAAFLANRAQGFERAFQHVAGLFAEFADGCVERGFFVFEFSLRNGPDTRVLVLPEGASRMNKKDFGWRIQAIKKDTRALLGRHIINIGQILLS